MLPRICILCSAASHERNICSTCLKKLPILSQHCRQCAQILYRTEEALCGECLNDPPSFDRTFALFAYDPLISDLIITLKFKHDLTHARAFAELLLDAIRNRWYLSTPLPDLIIPIPLHEKRLKERGFNQALEIARPLAYALNRRLDYTQTMRIKETAAQSNLQAAERKQNIKQAFHATANFTGLHVAVVDDVMTTGSTMREFCLILKQQGASQIDVWCCARR